jgi:hypothetical protein
VVDEHADVFTVVCEFKAEPRGLVVAMGKAWRTLATTLTARSVAAGKQWATTSTTLNPGARSSGVGSNGVAWVTTTTTLTTRDPYFSSVSLLLHMDGANGSTTFTDTSSNNLAITAVNSAQISTAQSMFGGASGAFDGTDDYLTSVNSSALSLGSGNFTMECWFYSTSSAQQAIFERRSSGFGSGDWVIYIGSSGNLEFYVSDYSGAVTLLNGANGATSQWHHIAIVRNGSNWTMYLNGSSISTATWSGTIADNSLGLTIGRDNGGSGRFYLSGYVDDLRITKGIARDASSFPPIGAFPDY